MQRQAVSASSTWQVGDIVADHYRIDANLGAGGFGQVYLVRHLEWDLDLVIKSPLRGREDMSLCLEEARHWIRLDLHPNVVHCLFFRLIEQQPWLFVEYVDGGSLQDRIAAGRLAQGGLAALLDIAIQAAWGLDHAHGKGLVHCDVKPGNILLASDGRARITDLGLSTAATGRAFGATTAYAAPEQHQGQPVSPKTDMFGWAVTVLHMSVGEVTWMVGAAAQRALESYVQTPPPQWLMSPGLVRVLRQCLHVDASERPQSMTDVAQSLVSEYRFVTGQAYPRPRPAATEKASDTLNNLAISHLDLGMNDEAERLLDECLSVDPHHLQARFNVTLLRWRLGRLGFEEAIAIVRRTDARAWEKSYLTSRLHLEAGHNETARDLLSEAQLDGAPAALLRPLSQRLEAGGDSIAASWALSRPVVDARDTELERQFSELSVRIHRSLALGASREAISVYQAVRALPGYARAPATVELAAALGRHTRRRLLVELWPEPVAGRVGRVVDWASDGQIVLVCEEKGLVVGPLGHQVGERRLPGVSGVLTRDGRYALSASPDGTIHTLDLESGAAPEAGFPGHDDARASHKRMDREASQALPVSTSNVTATALSGARGLVYIASRSELYQWRPGEAVSGPFLTLPRPVQGLGGVAGGHSLVAWYAPSGGSDKGDASTSVVLLVRKDAVWQSIPVAHLQDRVLSARVLDDGSVILLSTSTGVRYYDVRNSYRRHLGCPDVVDAALSPDGRTVFILRSDGSVWMWDGVEGEPKRVLSELGTSYEALHLAQDMNRFLLSGVSVPLRAYHIEWEHEPLDTEIKPGMRVAGWPGHRSIEWDQVPPEFETAWAESLTSMWRRAVWRLTTPRPDRHE